MLKCYLSNILLIISILCLIGFSKDINRGKIDYITLAERSLEDPDVLENYNIN